MALPSHDLTPGSGVRAPERRVPAEVAAPPVRADASLVTLANALLRRRTLIVGLGLLAGFLAGVVGLVSPRTYEASTTFMPQARPQASGFAALAAQFGVAMPNTDAGRSPAFYVDLVKTREILGPIVDSTFPGAGADGGPGTLADYLGASGRTPGARKADALRRLRDYMTVSAVQKTGVVNLAVRLESAPVAFHVVNAILKEVTRFDMSTRRSQAAAERRFTEQRLAETKADLRSAENVLQGFLQANRDYSHSPQLLFQYERLARDVGLRQQVYTTLAQAYEQSKIEEVRDTPVVTLVEAPEIPARPTPRGLVLKVVLATLVGALVGAMIVLVSEALRQAGDGGDNDYQEFDRLRREALGDLTHPWRLVTRLRVRR